MTKLSKRQQMILDYIKNEVAEKGYPPSVREIAVAVGLASSSTVHGHLSRIESKGYIRRDPTKPRAIEILDKSIDRNIPKEDRKSTRLNSSHVAISYAVFCLKKKKTQQIETRIMYTAIRR